MKFDMQVATPAPRTSQPRGIRTNMKSGSSAMFISPPKVMPKPASFDAPALRRRLDRTFDRTVGTPPKTMTQ